MDVYKRSPLWGLVTADNTGTAGEKEQGQQDQGAQAHAAPETVLIDVPDRLRAAV